MNLTLPEPEIAAQEISRLLIQRICSEISEQGPIPFARFMELALYAPGLGYYRNGLQKFGEQGDFITAPELSPLFSQCLARQCQQILSQISRPNILEFGAGSGVMARTILQTLSELQTLPEHYYILELSAELQQRQRLQLQKHLPEFYSRVVWLQQIPEHFTGIVLANEVLDAMPVHRFGVYQGLKEYTVDYRQNNLIWRLAPLSNARLAQSIERLGNWDEGYTSEINMLLPGWINSVAHSLEQGVILLSDYGMTGREYYHPDRGCGTLMCHYLHRAHDNPFWWPGLQDITAHVDFTAVAESAVDNRLEVSGYTHQAGFLLNCGITDFITGAEDPRTRLDLNRQIQRLTLPAEMGEAFKFMALTKNFSEKLLGFNHFDQLARL
ncbi:MAG: SAM-dependent methyltransferase [Proteobacteria bacterium]|nr:SAM-dependent methyltransferase [Pseudomonadota bacterium]